jgi:hypothetical protein
MERTPAIFPFVSNASPLFSLDYYSEERDLDSSFIRQEEEDKSAAFSSLKALFPQWTAGAGTEWEPSQDHREPVFVPDQGPNGMDCDFVANPLGVPP